MLDPRSRSFYLCRKCRSRHRRHRGRGLAAIQKVFADFINQDIINASNPALDKSTYFSHYPPLHGSELTLLYSSVFHSVCISKGNPCIQEKPQYSILKAMMRVLELLSIQFIAQFCNVGAIFALCLTVACKIHPSDIGHSTWPIVPLMKRPDRIDSEAWLRHCVDATNALAVDESIKVDFLGRLMILSGLAYDRSLINRILLQEGLMDAIMRESSFAQYIKQLGIEQGIEQGGRQRAIEDILDVLEIRFDLSEAHPLSSRIAAIEDLQRLKQLHRAAIQVSSLEAFEQVVDA